MNRRRGFTLVELLVVVAIIGVMMGLTMPALQQVRESARRTQCSFNLREIGEAMHMHDGARGQLPNASLWHTKYYSALTAILPYIDENSLYKHYDLTKDAFHEDNQLVAGQHIPLYLCPSMIRRREVPDRECDETAAMGSYAVCAGTGNLWAGPHDGAIIFDTEGTTSLNSLKDGRSSTILVGEMNYGLKNYTWTSGCRSSPRWGVVAWAIGYPGYSVGSTVGVFNSDRLVTGLAEFQTFRSDHAGGAFFLFGDCSVRFLEEDVNAELLDALATRADGDRIEY